MNYMIWRK